MTDQRGTEQHHRNDDQRAAIEAAVDRVRRDVRLEKLEEEVLELKGLLKEVLEKLDAIDVLMNRYKGGFLLLLALGGVVAWLSSVGGNLIRAFK